MHRQWASWRQSALELKNDVQALARACRDPRVPWQARTLAIAVVAYAVSPIDLIPDWIPVLGYLDDLLLLPLGIALAIRLVPAEVMADCRRATDDAAADRAGRWAAAAIVTIWLLVLLAVVFWAIHYWDGARLLALLRRHLAW